MEERSLIAAGSLKDEVDVRVFFELFEQGCESLRGVGEDEDEVIDIGHQLKLGDIHADVEGGAGRRDGGGLRRRRVGCRVRCR